MVDLRDYNPHDAPRHGRVSPAILANLYFAFACKRRARRLDRFPAKDENLSGHFVKVVMFHEVALDRPPKARVPPLPPAHRARLNAFHARGVFLMAGPFANPIEGAVGVFTSREAAEEFIQGDPFKGGRLDYCHFDSTIPLGQSSAIDRNAAGSRTLAHAMEMISNLAPFVHLQRTQKIQ